MKQVKMNGEENASREGYSSFKRRKVLWIYSLAFVCVVVAFVSLCSGKYHMSLLEVLDAIFSSETSPSHTAVWDIRLPRIIAAVLVGSALAIAGTVMQCSLRNPLASPYTLGISNAAALGAAVAIASSYLGWFSGTWFSDVLNSMYGMSLFAFLFSMATVVVVILLSRKSATPETIVLAGVAIGSIFSAALSSLQYFVDDTTLSQIVYWQFGDLSKATWSKLLILVAVLVPVVGYFIYHKIDYNSLEAGADVAKSLGIDTRKLILRTMVLSSLIASVCVSMVGIIGFVGLLGPHIMRRIIGGDHRYLLIASMVMGALVLLIADAVGRIPFESTVPVGIITSFFGGPLFLYILLIRRRHTE